MAGEQPIRPRRSLALGHEDRTLSPLARTRYFSPRSSSTLPSSATPTTPEFYANLSEKFGNPESTTYGQVYVRRHVINFSTANIAYYLSCPYFSDIEGIGLEEEADFDESLAETGYPLQMSLLFSRKELICSMPLPPGRGSTSALLSSETSSGCRDLSLPSNSWIKALDPMVMPKIVAPGVAPPFPTPSMQGHTSPGSSYPKRSSPAPNPWSKFIRKYKTDQKASTSINKAMILKLRPAVLLEFVQSQTSNTTIASRDRSCAIVQRVEDLRDSRSSSLFQGEALKS
ncbi:hypothetical protein M9H77_02340 [Catharanthus roseus]|uniref:Uncharacterized protein n=1 Tax=Catharanthus roseus TaxID=4058 RepID=A0ACC0C824_CATRO|nr:hypothetical protein M9H77_02340 [Catharanthus roseus]